MIRNVMFDLGGVLLDWSPDRLLAECFAESAVQEAVRQGAILHADWHELDRGTLEEEEAVRRFSVRCGRPESEMVAFFDHMKRSLVPKPGTVRLLEELHGAGVPLYCLSNMGGECGEYLQREYGFFRLFRGIVISAAVRMIKPEPGIYEYALQKFGLKASETVFIDDLAPNVEGARRVGMAGIQFVSAEDCRERLRGMGVGDGE